MALADRLIEQGRVRGQEEGHRAGLQAGHQQGRQEGRQEGRRRGLQEGLSAGRADMLLTLLAERFAPLPEPVIARVRDGTAADLERWARRVLTASELAQVFAP